MSGRFIFHHNSKSQGIQVLDFGIAEFQGSVLTDHACSYLGGLKEGIYESQISGSQGLRFSAISRGRP
jgi:hypothetical protein